MRHAGLVVKILVVVKQKKNVDTFLGTMRAFLDRGHAVTLAVQERHDERIEQYADDIASPRFALANCPSRRTDSWADTAPLLRSARDCLHYQRPALRGALKLQARTIDKLREDLRFEASDHEVAALLRGIPAPQVAELERVLGLAEARLPTDPLYDEFLRTERPDVLLLSPLVHFGSAQADLVASARAAGIPVGMLLFSWDNLSTKGALHLPPDWMFVWNERQRQEAADLHGFPAERVAVVGAPRFDAFFELRERMTGEEFLAPLGLDPSRPTLLYVCSSRFVSSEELPFINRWITALRSSTSPLVAECNVLVRPHPDIALLGDVSIEELRWPSVKGMKAFVSRPFNDPRAIVLRTSDRAQQGFFESIFHSAAVVGLNTSAELEAAIVGRPVYTVLADDADADGQRGTVHFHYLLEDQGGCVRVARSLEEHTAQIARELGHPSDPGALSQFVGSFLRPLGIDRQVAPLLAEAIERTFEASTSGPRADGEHLIPAELPPEAVEISREDARTVVSLGVGFEKAAIRVFASSSPSGRRPRFDRTTTEWLQQHVRIGDVVYDVDAGIGLYSVMAAKQRGAVVVAFEPGFAAFKALCDNLQLNACDGAVVAVPLAVADFEGLGELKFPSDGAGEERHSLRAGGWREKRSAREGRTIVQTVCVTTLDGALRRYEWPAPNHLRVSETASAELVLAGAPQVLGSPALKTIFLTVSSEAGAVPAIAAEGWRVVLSAPISRGRTHVLLSRDTADSP